MVQKSISGRSLEKTITSDDILGKDVVDKNGDLIGIVEKVLISLDTLEFIGIEVDKGILKKGLAIGKDYIEKVTDDALWLNIKISYELNGMSVFDKLGKLVGKVNKVELEGSTNKIKNIYVKPGIFRKSIEIPRRMIQTIKYNIILNVDKSVLTLAQPKESK